MIRFVRGIYRRNTLDSIIVETKSGLGLEIFVPTGSSLYAADEGDEVLVHTSMKVREDDMSLYGFDNRESMELFELLITVNGVGAKAGMSIMSTLPPSKLRVAIATGDVKALSKANGIGKKTSERIILELKDKIGPVDTEEAGIKAEDFSELITNDDAKSEAVAALTSLGYAKNEAIEAIAKVKGDNLSVEDYIMQALKNF